MFGALALMLQLGISPARADNTRLPECTIPVFVSQANVPLPVFKYYTHAIYDAALQWNNTSENFHLFIKDWDFQSDPQYGTVTISMTRVQQLQPNQIALTWNKQYETGFSRSRMEIDNTWNYCTSAASAPTCVNIFNVIVHEFGHVLGLDHSTDPDSVMYPVIPIGPERRSLTSEDIQAVRNAYRSDGSSCEVSPFGTIVWAID